MTHFRGNLRNSSLPVTAAEREGDTGDREIVLRIGTPGNPVLDVVAVVLPDKGYVQRSATMRMRGIVVSREENSDFIATPLGLWLPLHSVREAYRIGESGRPVLSSRMEALAFEPPRLNVELDPRLFDLRLDRELQNATGDSRGQSSARSDRHEERVSSLWTLVVLSLIAFSACLACYSVARVRRAGP